MQYLDNEDHLFLSDFPLAVTLAYLGHQVIALEEDEFGKSHFTFGKTQHALDAVREYWNGGITVEPKRFWALGREMKSRIRSESYGAQKRRH